MPRMPAYQSRYGDAITELLSRRGDIAAQGAMRSGEIWGSTLSGLGQLAGQTYADISQQKQQQKAMEVQAKAFDDALSTYDPLKPMDTYRKLATVVGPEKAIDITKGFQAFGQLKSAQKPEEAMAALPKLAAGFEAAPEGVKAQLWTPVRQALISAGVTDASMPEQYDPETAAGYIQFAKGLGEQTKPQGLMSVAPGTRVFDPNTREEVFAAPEKPRQTVAEIEAEAAARARGAATVRTPADERIVQIAGPDGPMWVRESQAIGKQAAQADRPSIGAERKALSYYQRAQDAQEITESLEASGELSPARMKYTPDWANFLQSDANQRYVQAQRAFTEARLRKESGAAIPKHEYDSDAKTYFPQPGDSEATIKQKREGREKVLQGLAFESGKAFREFYGTAPPKAGQSMKGTNAEPPDAK